MNNSLPFVTDFAIQNYMSAEKGIVFAAEHGFQVWYIDLDIKEDKLDNWDTARINQLHNLIKKYMIKPILHSSFTAPLAVNIQELRQAGIQTVKKEIDLAYQLNAPIIIHGGAVSKINTCKSSKESATRTYLSSLLELQEYANKFNVSLYLENLCNFINDQSYHYVFSEVEEFQYILDQIDLSLYLDIGHANLSNNCPIDIFKQFNKRIVGMCFSNNDGINDLHLDIEDGNIDYKELVKSIIETKWNGLVAFETRNQIARQNITSIVNIYNSLSYKNK